MTRKLALVIHFHQPVGNLDAVVRTATERCYRPFLELLEKSPEVKITLHYSGCLLEWLEDNASDVPDMIRNLVDRGQVEMMTGGFYEPILAALPRRDQVGQIQMLTQHLEHGYGAGASGAWLTERVWEQDVVGALTEAGVRYTVLDDTMFHSVGITDEQLRGPFVTDHEGRPLLLYAGDRRLRYLIPYKKVERITEYVRSGPEDRLYVYADDGEKFGEWPDTYERVYEDGWLASFFEELTSNTRDVELVTLGAHAAEAQPEGRVYLPSSSYDEMMTWALPAEARLKVGRLRRQLQKDDPGGALPFLRGAPWRAFLAKYPEVNQLQKRMMFVSARLHSAGASPEAFRELYRAQCNCAYWHGAFGGVYLAFMRTALWHHLMKAEASVDVLDKATIADLDADARDEVLLSGPWGAAVISPHDGLVVELDDWQVGANLLAVAARHREAYHLEDENPPGDDEVDEGEMVVSQARSEVAVESLTFDTRRLGGVVDLIDGEPIAAPFTWHLDGATLLASAEDDGLRIDKTFTATDRGLSCGVRVTNTGPESFHGTFGSETAALPLNLGRNTERDHLERTGSGWRLAQPEGEVALVVTVDPAGTVSSEAIETASTSLEGLQSMFQGTIVTVSWPLELAPRTSLEVHLTLAPEPHPENFGKKEPGVSA